MLNNLRQLQLILVVSRLLKSIVITVKFRKTLKGVNDKLKKHVIARRNDEAISSLRMNVTCQRRDCHASLAMTKGL